MILADGLPFWLAGRATSGNRMQDATTRLSTTLADRYRLEPSGYRGQGAERAPHAAAQGAQHWRRRAAVPNATFQRTCGYSWS